MSEISFEQLEQSARDLGYALVERPTNEQKLANILAEIDRIEALREPSEKELLEWARDNHDYYREQDMLAFYYKDKEAYENLIRRER